MWNNSQVLVRLRTFHSPMPSVNILYVVYFVTIFLEMQLDTPFARLRVFRAVHTFRLEFPANVLLAPSKHVQSAGINVS
jgi:hypothetical protein